MDGPKYLSWEERKPLLKRFAQEVTIDAAAELLSLKGGRPANSRPLPLLHKVLVAHAVEKKRFEEIAKEVGKSKENTRVIFWTALDRLHRLQEQKAARPSADASTAELLASPVSALNLSVRAANALETANIQTIGDLVHWSANDLRRAKNCGSRTINELRDLLDGLGLALKADPVKLPIGWFGRAAVQHVAQLFEATSSNDERLRIYEEILSIR